MAAAGKDGFLHIVDRATHKRIARTAVTTVDDPAPVPTPEGIEACPGPAGGVCHGIEGNAWNNVDLKAIKQKMDLDALVTFIKKPRAPMPQVFAKPFSQADEKRIRDIAAYIMQWQ